MPKKLISFLGCLLISVLLCFSSSLPRLPHHWVRAQCLLAMRRTSAQWTLLGWWTCKPHTSPLCSQLCFRSWMWALSPSMQTLAETFPAGGLSCLWSCPSSRNVPLISVRSRGAILWAGVCAAVRGSAQLLAVPGGDNPTLVPVQKLSKTGHCNCDPSMAFYTSKYII